MRLRLKSNVTVEPTVAFGSTTYGNTITRCNNQLQRGTVVEVIDRVSTSRLLVRGNLPPFVPGNKGIEAVAVVWADNLDSV